MEPQGKITKKKLLKKNQKQPINRVKKIKNAKGNNLLTQFNKLGAIKWLNLTTMDQNRPYVLTDLKRTSTKFGERLMAELDGTYKLYLPERYNVFTDRQLLQLVRGKCTLTNKGCEGGMTYKLEINEEVRNEEQSGNNAFTARLSPVYEFVCEGATTKTNFKYQYDHQEGDRPMWFDGRGFERERTGVFCKSCYKIGGREACFYPFELKITGQERGFCGMLAAAIGICGNCKSPTYTVKKL